MQIQFATAGLQLRQEPTKSCSDRPCRSTDQAALWGIDLNPA
jgi:hypothetical protein